MSLAYKLSRFANNQKLVITALKDKASRVWLHGEIIEMIIGWGKQEKSDTMDANVRFWTGHDPSPKYSKRDSTAHQ